MDIILLQHGDRTFYSNFWTIWECKESRRSYINYLLRNNALYLQLLCEFFSEWVSERPLMIVEIFFQIPLTKLFKASVTKYLTLFFIFLISIFMAISTRWGFPYQNELSGNPVVQRHFIAVRLKTFLRFTSTLSILQKQHTARNFFDEFGGVKHSDGGFYFMEWDRHSRKTIESITIPDMPVHISEMCNDEVLCGLPLTSIRLLMMGFVKKFLFRKNL